MNTESPKVRTGQGSTKFDRFLGYYEPYATSHEALDRDTAFMEEKKMSR